MQVWFCGAGLAYVSKLADHPGDRCGHDIIDGTVYLLANFCEPSLAG